MLSGSLCLKLKVLEIAVVNERFTIKAYLYQLVVVF